MTVFHVVSSVDRQAAGVGSAVLSLTRSLACAGTDTRLLSVGDPSNCHEAMWTSSVFAQDYDAVPGIRTLAFSSKLRDTLLKSKEACSLIHNHGLWRMPNIYACQAAFKTGKPLVCSVHGMLSPASLGFSAASKRIFSAIVQRGALRAVTCFHATSAGEARDLRAYGITQPIAVIPYGVAPPGQAIAKRAGGSQTVVFLGRLHPIKGLENLLHAWSRVQSGFPQWRLRLIGPSENEFDRTLRELATSLALANITIEGPSYGVDKDRALREADLLVLPSASENFGLVVAEALAAGTPVLASSGTPWEGVIERRCGWWVDPSAESLARTFATIFSTPPTELAEMGLRGQRWIHDEFSWSRVAHLMQGVYAWCTGHQSRPQTVELS